MNKQYQAGVQISFRMNTRNRLKTGNTKKYYFLLILLLQFSLSGAQSFSNLGFEYWQGNKFPLFWQPLGITVSPDSVTKLSSPYSLKAVRLQSEIEAVKIPYGLLFQDVQTAFGYAALQNKKLEISARIKSKFADTSAQVSAFIQIIDLQNPGNNNISIGNNVANQDWATSSASITAGKITPTTSIVMGVIIMGKGEIWIDDYQITCDRQSPRETYPRTADLTEKEKKWLTSHIIPISGETLANPKQFTKKISGAHLVGIGDNVHGSASVVKLKNIISKNLIENEDFTLLAIEDSPCTGEAVNQYILGLTDRETNDINAMYANPGFKSFLSWLKEYNKSAAKKVKVFGVDINSRYENQIKYIDRSTSNKYSVQLDSIHSILESIFKIWNPKIGNPTTHSKIPFTQEQRQYYKTNLEHIKAAVPSLNIDHTQKTLLGYYINNLLHYLTFDRQEREKQMAENINWLLSEYPNEKMIYLAHNSHVGNSKTYSGDKRTGAWLKEMLNDKYYIIGTCYFDGTDIYKQAALGNSQPIINEAIKGSYEYLLHQIKEECFYLDLNKQKKNPANQWLFQPMLMRNYGVEPFNYYHEFSITNLTREYNGIVFIKRSVPL